jgi:hypothetical protein
VLVTRQKIMPGGSGCGGAADEPVAANETMTFWQARSRQTSTVTPAVALSPSQVKVGLIEVEIAVDSGAINRGAVRGDAAPVVGVGVGGVGVGAELPAGGGSELELDVGEL